MNNFNYLVLLLAALLGGSMAGDISVDHLLSLSEVLVKLEYLSEGGFADQAQEPEFIERLLDIEDVTRAYEYLSEFNPEAIKAHQRLSLLYQALIEAFEGRVYPTFGKTSDEEQENKDRDILVALKEEYLRLRRVAVDPKDTNVNRLKGTVTGQLIESLLCDHMKFERPLASDLVEEAYQEYVSIRNADSAHAKDSDEAHGMIERRAIYLGNEPVRGLTQTVFRNSDMDQENMRATFEGYFCGAEASSKKCIDLKTNFYNGICV